jgi:exodeoxyribonuclease V gamma subunit
VLTVYRGNRAELLAELLATQLRLAPPDPFTVVEVVVNTWPTSRWLGEQLAGHLGGVAANLRFPFPGSHLRRSVDTLLGDGDAEAGGNTGGDGGDPWRADRLVWSVLPLLPQVAAMAEGEPLRRWLGDRNPDQRLGLDTWRLARSIADTFDDYTLYRPDLLQAWGEGRLGPADTPELPESQRWQPLLYRALRQRLGRDPFGLRVEGLIQLLAGQGAGLASKGAALARPGEGPGPASAIDPQPLRLFGLSSLAPVQVRLLQALSGHRQVDLFLLTPCPDLWQRCTDRRQRLRDALALQDPLDGDWLLEAPGLEARFGRLGAEFQQLLEGTGEAQLGESREADLFVLPTQAPGPGAPPPPLLLQLQRQLADPDRNDRLQHDGDDHSLEFHACPGPLRQVQIVRDRLLQLMAADPSLEPRDILVMTPQVEALAPLVAAVFGDTGATGVSLPWRLTDRSQQGTGGVDRCLLALLEQAGERLTASALEGILDCPALLRRFQLEPHEGARLNGVLQRCGFRWGLDAAQRGGEATHSLAWAIDRLLLGLVLPLQPGLAPGDPPTAPASSEAPLDLSGRWLHLLTRLHHWLVLIGRAATVAGWAERLRRLLPDLFDDGDDGASDLADLLAALDDWQELAGDAPALLEAPVVAAILRESLSADSGRFGHRSGCLTISALEPMRAIPHRVVVLMGLDGTCFPRTNERPGFHLLDLQRRLGDPQPADQDRYVLLEALLSARSHLLVSWSCRDDRLGEDLPPAAPVRQWLDWLDASLEGGLGNLLVRHAASPLERRNFLPSTGRPPASCDQRWLEARRQLEAATADPLLPLVHRPMPERELHKELGASAAGEGDPFADLRAWLMEPQRHWLRQLGLRPAEWHPSLDDLEALSLDERRRSELLRGLDGLDTGPHDPDAWLERTRGQGILPSGSGAPLEARTLENRRRSLQELAASLGPAGSGTLAWGPWQADCCWQGDVLVVTHLGRAQAPQQLDLWLQLLLAGAAAPGDGPRPSRGVVLSRDGLDNFTLSTTLETPTAEAARQELERLWQLRQQWHDRCWPVPPRSGWAWWEEERKGKGGGLTKARTVWEESAERPGERRRPEMALCFGADLSTASLVAGNFSALAADLFEPIQRALVAPSRRSGKGRS